MDRRSFVGAGVCGALLLPLVANAQPREKVARLGFLAGFPRPTTQGSAPTTIAERLRELEYVAETDERLRELASQLVATGSRVIYAQGPYALRAARAASAITPIVGFDHETDPVAAGYAASLARPGGNVTGVFLDQVEISAKQLQLLRELVPGLTRVAVADDAIK